MRAHHADAGLFILPPWEECTAVIDARSRRHESVPAASPIRPAGVVAVRDRRVDRLRTWADHVRGCRRLGPLWRLLHAVDPPVVASHRTAELPGAAAHYRRIVEIRAAQRALERHVPTALPTWMADQDQPTREAATIVAALAVCRTLVGGALPTAPAPRTPVPGARERRTPAFLADVAAESAHLQAVSRAVHHSPVVDLVGYRERPR